MTTKKALSGKRAACATVEDYFSRLDGPTRRRLAQMRAAIRAAAPKEATETISYRIPCFKYKGMLVWYAAFAKHCSLFPRAEVIEQFKNELKGYSTSKGTIHFPHDKPLPIALIKKIVKARVAQNEGRSSC